MFHPPKDRQNVLETPATIAELAPGIVIERLAAHENQAIDRAGAAQKLAARHRNAAVRGGFLRARNGNTNDWRR